jgi:PAS domain S-box-containing protein
MHPFWKEFISQTQVVMLALDKHGNFIAVNPAAEKVFARSAAELVGNPFSYVLDPYSHEKAVLMIVRTLQEGSVMEWELDHLQPDGVPVLLGYSTTLLKEENGDILGLGAYGVDLTSKLELTSRLATTNQELEGTLFKLEKTLAELKSTQAQLVQAEKMRSLGQLVAGIAHEINNPAAFVSNNLAHLQRLVPALRQLFIAYLPLKAAAGPDQLEIIQAAEAAAGLDYLWDDLQDITAESMDGIERIRNIVLSLRTFSHLGEADLKQVNISEGLRSTLRLVRPMGKNRVRFVENIEDLPLISCYPGELNQVFLNLLTNAVQSIEGEGQVEVTAFQQDQRLVITIRDTGCGMDANTLAHLGEPFFTTKPVGSGTGLGLSISYGIVERHGGKLGFESQPGVGTTATVEVPV